MRAEKARNSDGRLVELASRYCPRPPLIPNPGNPMNQLERIFNCIEHLENLKKQATVERSHFYVGSAVTDAIKLLYEFAETFKEKP